MSDPVGDTPVRVMPYVAQEALDQPITVLGGPFQLGDHKGSVDSDLVFRWVPTTAVAFEGPCSTPCPDLNEQWSFDLDDPALNVPVVGVGASRRPAGITIRGVLRGPLSLGQGPFEVLRFSLANFPDYIGAPVRYDEEDPVSAMLGRLQVSAGPGDCQVDQILEASELRAAAKSESGYVLSHAGEWLPPSGQMTVAEAESVLEMLHMWFGLLRGAWSGPLFPQGLAGGEVAWRQFAAWKLGERRQVTTWMPEQTPLKLSALFTGFQERWNDAAWREPLRYAISWFVEANSSGVARESCIILAQVALELLAWVHLVETQRLYTRKAFERLRAAGRMRVLLEKVGVPAAVPDYMSDLRDFCGRSGFDDGPAAIIWLRNALVHSSAEKRSDTDALNGMAWHECSQLALQYIELVLLAICGHDGHYARRGFRGWKGDDEVLVPWA